MPARSRLVVGLDAGTSGATALVLDDDGRVRGRAARPLRQSYPHPGWVEHDLKEIQATAVGALADALAAAGAHPRDVVAVGLTNQRETACAWTDDGPLAPAIVWQDRRTAARCRELAEAGEGGWLRERTGLPLDPYFTAAKLEWLLRHDRAVRDAADGSRLRLGTVDAWLVHRLSGGRSHVTDATNASRTQLLDLRSLRWDDEALELFGVPRAALPEVVASCGELARMDPASSAGVAAPVAGIAGDQQAALFGQGCFEPGDAKTTYGTGAFLLVATGSELRRTVDGVSTLALLDEQGRATYALEGSVFVAGAAIQWLRDELGVLASAEESEALGRAAPDGGGVVLVPAFAGLGAPYWDPAARGAVLGLTRGTGRAELARAALEGIAHGTADVLEALCPDGLGAAMRVDGGASRNGLLLELQADLAGCAVERPADIETTALGAAWLAGIGTGVWRRDEIAATNPVDLRIEPRMDDAERTAARARWRAAVAAVRSFAG